MVDQERMCKDETIRLRDKHIAQNCELFFGSSPLKIVKAKGQFMYDENGEEYLDCINNVAHVGHCHPRVVEAGCQQMAVLSTNNRYLHDQLVILAERLTNLMPAGLSICYMVNSGSEANDLALRLARTYTGNEDVVTLDHAYHGHLNTMIDISPYKFKLPGGTPQRDWVHVAPVPDSYRGKYRMGEHANTEEELGALFAADVGEICGKLKASGKGVCAFIAESLQSCGGQIIPQPGYLQKVYEYIRAAGGLCIADEVQVGFGRIGSHMWAFEPQGVVPDIVTLGKPMGNGHPVACVMTTKAIAAKFRDTGVRYFNTYGGNPVSCAIANAVLDVIQDEKLMEHAQKVGNKLLDGLRSLGVKHQLVGDVRGLGLFSGVELVLDRKKKTPATDIATHIVNRLKQEHVLISSDGPDTNVLKFKPPMVFNEDNVNRLISLLDRVLTEVEEQIAVSGGFNVSTISSNHAQNSANLLRPSADQNLKSI